MKTDLEQQAFDVAEAFFGRFLSKLARRQRPGQVGFTLANPTVSMVPPPRGLQGFPDATKSRPKTPRPGGGLRMRWKDPDDTIHERDYRHGHVEAYDFRGRHIGGYDAATGVQVSRAVSTRRVEP